MSRISKNKQSSIIESIKATKPTIIFYTDKINIRLKNVKSISYWKDKFPNGKVRFC